MEPLCVPASLESLDEIRRYVTTMAQDAGLSKSATYRLHLAVDEIATNIVTYGYERAGLSGDITVSGTVTEQAVTITVRDAAAAFDPRSHELPDEDDLAVPLDEREIGGLGIFLAVNGVDQFSYERDGDHNLTSFTMWREAREG